MQSWRSMSLAACVGAAALIVGLTGCGGAGASNDAPTTPTTNNPGAVPAADPNQVVLGDLSFNPGTVTVAAGTTVTWTWPSCTDTGGGCVSHNVTFDDGSNIASKTQSTGTFSRIFSTVGTYGYHCSIHGAGLMSGKVVVK